MRICTTLARRFCSQWPSDRQPAVFTTAVTDNPLETPAIYPRWVFCEGGGPKHDNRCFTSTACSS